jgi:NAD(P)-dependent dehydrogenase (short-subunit alcohol dehydrogenase family)
MPSLQGKVALVTGAGRGMGAVIASKLAEYGATVAVSDADSAAAKAVSAKLNDGGLTTRAYEYDVRRWEAAQRIAAAVDSDLGGVDILVNNAGVSKIVPFLDLDEAEWDRLMNINLKGVFLTCRAVLPGMVKRKRGGRVINMGSVLSKLGEANFAHYAASKFGVLGLTQTISAEMARHGITANTVCPGIVITPLWEDLFKQAVDSKAFEDEGAVRDFLDSRIPLGRPQPAEDVAEMVAYLASDLARNITGGSFHVDGGMQPR